MLLKGLSIIGICQLCRSITTVPCSTLPHQRAILIGRSTTSRMGLKVPAGLCRISLDFLYLRLSQLHGTTRRFNVVLLTKPGLALISAAVLAELSASISPISIRPALPMGTIYPESLPSALQTFQVTVREPHHVRPTIQI